jgi:hypothetical protein
VHSTAGFYPAYWASPTLRFSSRSTNSSRSLHVRNHFYTTQIPHMRHLRIVSKPHSTHTHIHTRTHARTERHSPDKHVTAHAILFCSAVAKMVASVATYPHEVVRTRLQTQRRLLLPSGAPRKRSGIIRTTRKIIHFEGWRGLYKGLSVNLIRTVPNSAVTMLT